MDEDKNLEELMAQFRELEKSSIQLDKTGISSISGDHTKISSFFKSYGIYLLFFVWTFFLILALQPSYLFKKIENSDKYKFLWKRFLIVFLISYILLVICYIAFQYYIKKL